MQKNNWNYIYWIVHDSGTNYLPGMNKLCTEGLNHKTTTEKLVKELKASGSKLSHKKSFISPWPEKLPYREEAPTLKPA